MNKLFLLALLGFALIALTGAENEDNSLQIKEAEDLEIREIREANPANSDATKKQKKADRKAAKKALKKEKNNKSKKSKKSSKKTKSGKAKKTSKKGKRKAKSMRKNVDKKQKKKEKKGEKKQKKAVNSINKVKGNRSSKSGSARQTCTVSDSCISNAVSYLRIVQNQVANFKNQKDRIVRQNTTGIRKDDKKDVFSAALNRLVDFAGGNKTAPTCGSLTSGAGVNNIKNLTDTLSKCSDTIKAACNISALPQPNTTFLEDCTKKTEAFETGVEACRQKTGADACTCWTKATLGADVETIKKCTLSNEASLMAKAVTACKAAFSNCRKFEDEVSGAIHSCSVSTDGLKSKLKSLAANTEAVTKAKDKINVIINSRQMVSRQAPAATCAQIISISAELLALIGQAPASPKVALLAVSISTTTASCSAAEKASLKKSVASFETALAAIASEVAAAQATLLQATGSTASAADIAAAPSCATDTCAPPSVVQTTVAPATTTPATTMTTRAPTATNAPTGRRRRQVVEDILKSKLL